MRVSPRFTIKHMLVLIAFVFALSAALLVIMASSAATTIGSTPDFAISMASGQSAGILSPGERRWYAVVPNQNGEQYQNAAFSMFFTPQDGSVPNNVNFQIFDGGEISSWQQGQKPAPANFGAGMPVSRTGNPATGERIWRGTVLRDGTYYLSIENASGAPVDYWLYNGERAGPQQSIPAPPVAVNNGSAAMPAAEPAAAPSPATGQSPFEAIPFLAARQTGKLWPGQEMWLSFAVNNTPEQFEPAALTLIITPDNGQRVWGVGFDIYTAGAVQAWAAGSSPLYNVGAGSVVQRDGDPATGERLWSGWVVNNDLYYVRIANSNAEPVDYWLFNGDVSRPDLSP